MTLSAEELLEATSSKIDPARRLALNYLLLLKSSSG
jgi:hypothetical protein